MDIKILEIATDTKNIKNISNFTHSSKLKNNLCGDEVRIQLILKKNFIKDFGYNCNSCVYCQASANILSKYSKDKSLNIIKELILSAEKFFVEENYKLPNKWKSLTKIFLKKNIARKDCILLPFKALAKALK
tara:strand:- start:326 stop:721 length:396 start_codon:yes stop_codon:yes gene_type:complete